MPHPDATLVPCANAPLGFDPDDLAHRDAWRQVGDGSFGKVYRGELLGEAVAIKVTANARPDRIAGLKRDLWYLNAFAHPNITRVYGAFIERGDCHMVMEFVPHSLRSKASGERDESSEGAGGRGESADARARGGTRAQGCEGEECADIRGTRGKGTRRRDATRDARRREGERKYLD